MKYLITGINGFVGPHLADLLIDEGHEVAGLIRGSNGNQYDLLDVLTVEKIECINWIFGDLTDVNNIHDIFRKNKFDGVFHLASQSHPPTSFSNPILTFNVNVMGSVLLINAISNLSSDTKFMFCSTSEVYGDRFDEISTINSSIAPINPYGVTKSAIDIYMQERMKNGFIEGFITRAFSHTGPRRGKNFSISSDAYQIAKIMKNFQKPTLLVGNLKTNRAVLDVRDVVKAYYLLMINKKSNGRIFNICDDEYHKMQYYTDILIDISGIKNVKYKIHKPFYRPIDIDIQIGDTTDLEELTGWEKKISIEKTLKDLLNYWVKKIG